MAAVLALWVLVSSALSVSPELHHLLCPDASDRAHQCAITLFSQHQVLLENGVAPLFIFAVGFFFWSPLLLASAFARMDARLAPSRAPPVLL